MMMDLIHKMKYFIKRDDFIRFYNYLYNVIDDFVCFSGGSRVRQIMV